MGNRQPTALELLIALLSTGAAVWWMLPEHQRQLIAMRALDGGRRLAARMASLQGHAGMGDELAGGRLAGQHYATAYRLARVRDELARRLDGMRP